MTDIAKIALIGGEITITKHALECIIKSEGYTSEQKQIYGRVINKIEKATQKTRTARTLEQQQDLGIGKRNK